MAIKMTLGELKQKLNEMPPEMDGKEVQDGCGDVLVDLKMEEECLTLGFQDLEGEEEDEEWEEVDEDDGSDLEEETPEGDDYGDY